MSEAGEVGVSAIIEYRLEFKSTDLMSEKAKAMFGNPQAYVLCKVVLNSVGDVVAFEDVAIFNLDSEARHFERYLMDGGEIRVTADAVELYELTKKNRGIR